jgi:hypothetical protein
MAADTQPATPVTATTDTVVTDTVVTDTVVTDSVATGTASPALDGPVAVAGGDTTPPRRRFTDMSRRGFLRTGSIGVVAAGVVGSVPGLSSLLSSAESDAPAAGAATTEVSGVAAASSPEVSGVGQSLGAHVSDLSTGEMRLFVGNQTLNIRDPALAQHLTQAVRAAQAAG